MPETVLVTGATGYIAKHIVLQLLNAGYSVTGSTRSLAREGELRQALEPHLDDPAALGRLRVVALDLEKDSGWDQAMDGVDALMHTASPFPLAQPKNEDDLIRPAVDGALRAVRAAHKAGVTRVVMTSSSAAISNTGLPPGRTIHDETDWTDIADPRCTPYVKSKTLAEKAVWDWQRADAPDMQITMINPVFVQGAPLDGNVGTSLAVIERLMKGTDPMLPKVGFACVDVRDIALMHLRALERPGSIGHRIAGSDRFLWFAEMAEILKAEYPDRKIATRTAPNVAIRLLGLFDPAVRTILPALGKRDEIAGAKAREMLGIDFRDARQSVREGAAALVRLGLA